MGRSPRDGIVLLPRILSHNPEVPHAFNHTDGMCPKCASKGPHTVFCLQNQAVLPRVSGCEVEGEHLHRQCAACGYPWVERCYDQLLMSQTEGWLLVESEVMALLAMTVHRTAGISASQALVAGYRGWKLNFTRDTVAGTVTITAEPMPPQGTPAHPELRNLGRGPAPSGAA